MKTEKTAKQVIILGGGYAGVNAALRLRLRHKTAKITLVNERREFIERIRNHQHSAGQKLQSHDLAAVLGSGIEFMAARAEKIDTATRQLVVKAAGAVSRLDYDVLVYALGSGQAAIQTDGYQINTREGAEMLRADLERRKTAAVVILGAGLTGLELATELRENYPERFITLMDRKRPGSYLSIKGQEYLNQTLADMKIGFEMPAADAFPGKSIADQHRIIVNCTGFSSPELAKKSGLACDEKNRVLVNEYLQAEGHPRIFVAGDAAACGFGTNAIAYAGCATAMPMGTYAGEAVAQYLAGEQLPEFRYGFTFQCISLGRKRGIIQFLDKRTGVATNRVMTGKSAAVFKELICKMTVTLPRWEKKTRWPFYTWRKTRFMKKIGSMAAKAA